MSHDNDRYARGLEIRKEVLGAEHVQRSLDASTDFNRAIQELVTSYCWGEIWARTALDRRTRSLINIAMLSVLRSSHELKLHVRGALRNGCTVDEIKETLLQVSIYGGVPASMEAFRTAEAVIDEWIRDGGPLAGSGVQ